MLLDTNVLLRHGNTADPQQGRLKARLEGLSEQTELCISRQNLHEYWVVATRPRDVNGFGLSAVEASRHLRRLLDAYRLLDDPARQLERRIDLCVRYEVIGKRAHDARLVAFMLEHGIHQLGTLNPGDFVAFSEIELVVL